MTKLESMLDRPIAFHRCYVTVTQSVTASLMLSQAMYWSLRTKPDSGGWFYKTMKEWSDETGLTRSEQDTARSKLVKLGLIIEKRAGIPAKLHFKVQQDRLFELLEACNQDCRNPANWNAGKQRSITETTAETTEKSLISPSKQPSCLGNPTPTPPLPDARQAAQPPSGAVQGCRDTAKPPKASPASKETWLTAYAEEWEKATRGGAMPCSKAARALKEAEARHGREAVLLAWRRYCRVTDPAFLSPHSFVAKIGIWMEPKAQVTEKQNGRYITENDIGSMVSSK